MFKRMFNLDPADKSTVTLRFEDKVVVAQMGETVAAALLASGIVCCRTTPISGAPRSPYCMMGVCFECLVEVDGIPNIQSCQVEVYEGMQIRTQEGARRLAT